MSFEAAVEVLLAQEGGYANDPRDKGGETKFGISKRSYPELDLPTLTREQAIDIYRRDWWDKYGYGRLRSPLLQNVLFLFAVNAGPHPAARILQQALYDLGVLVAVDSLLGPQTIQAANDYDKPDALIDLVRAGQIHYYRSLHQPHYLAGWVRRAMAGVLLALVLSGCAISTTREQHEVTFYDRPWPSQCIKDWYEWGLSYAAAVRACVPFE